MSDGTLVISARALRLTLATVAAVTIVAALVFLPAARQTLAAAFAPRTVADQTTLTTQRAATESAIQRGYAKAMDQLRQVRELTLAIPRAEADAINTRALQELRVIRRDALIVVGQLVGMTGPQLETYVTSTEAGLDTGATRTGDPVLLAPELFAVVRRADELFQQRADAATRELTRAPSPSPSASPGPSPRP